MSESGQSAPNYFAYSANRQVFKVVGSTLLVSARRFEDRVVEVRELHLKSIPDSKNLKSEFGAMVLRIVEYDPEPKVDKSGTPIVGGVNSYPEPAHVVLFVTPNALALLSQRVARERCLVTIYPGTDLLSWDREAAIPIYEASISVEGQ